MDACLRKVMIIIQERTNKDDGTEKSRQNGIY